MDFILVCCFLCFVCLFSFWRFRIDRVKNRWTKRIDQCSVHLTVCAATTFFFVSNQFKWANEMKWMRLVRSAFSLLLFSFSHLLFELKRRDSVVIWILWNGELTSLQRLWLILAIKSDKCMTIEINIFFYLVSVKNKMKKKEKIEKSDDVERRVTLFLLHSIYVARKAFVRSILIRLKSIQNKNAVILRNFGNYIIAEREKNEWRTRIWISCDQWWWHSCLVGVKVR